MDFEKIYNVYFMEVYSYIMTLVGSQTEAEELAQKVFFKAMNTSKPYKGNSSELTWLCAIAKNLCTDRFREQSRMREMDEEAVSSFSVERIVEDEDAMLRIHQILHTMEEPYKEIFQLRVFGELSFQKIGIIFGKSENWSRVTYHRARLKIQERMEIV